MRVATLFLPLTALVLVVATIGAGGQIMKKVSLKTPLRTISTTGASGWIQFCPANNEGNSGDYPSTKCISICAVGFQELDSRNSAVAVNSVFGDGSKRRINDLQSAMTVSSPTTSKMPVCGTSAAIEGQACGVADGGGALEFEALPASFDLSSVTSSGELLLTSMIFTNSGTLRLDGRSYTISKGTTKFDVSMKNYVFGVRGSKITFQLRIKIKDHEESALGVITNATGFVNVGSGAIVCVPRYSYKTRSTVNATVQWKGANIVKTQAGSNTVLQFTFEGPFLEMHYDPFVASPTDSSVSQTPGSSAAHLTGAMSIVFALAAAVFATL